MLLLWVDNAGSGYVDRIGTWVVDLRFDILPFIPASILAGVLVGRVAALPARLGAGIAAGRQRAADIAPPREPIPARGGAQE
jgi:hypothetical protein